MIKDVNLKPFEKSVFLPAYVSNIGIYTLTAKVLGDYEITLAQLVIGDTMSAGVPLTHVLFRSYTSKGKKCTESRTRVSGFEREFIAVKSAMFNVGIIFEPIVPCHFLELLNSVGAYYQADNQDIQSYEILSQVSY